MDIQHYRDIMGIKTKLQYSQDDNGKGHTLQEIDVPFEKMKIFNAVVSFIKQTEHAEEIEAAPAAPAAPVAPTAPAAPAAPQK